jgi:secondary thiamine-phosphate synthase enzyme
VADFAAKKALTQGRAQPLFDLGGVATSSVSSAQEAAAGAVLRLAQAAPHSEPTIRKREMLAGNPRRVSTNGHGASGGLRVVNELLVIETSLAPQFIDITDRVADFVERSQITSGQLLAFSRHTTAAIRVQEAEPLLLEDMTACLERLAPRELAYRHNDFRVRTVNMTDDESPNGHAHCRHLFLGASETVPVLGGSLALGRWQRLFLIELDHPRTREVHLQVMGQ